MAAIFRTNDFTGMSAANAEEASPLPIWYAPGLRRPRSRRSSCVSRLSYDSDAASWQVKQVGRVPRVWSAAMSGCIMLIRYLLIDATGRPFAEVLCTGQSQIRS